LLAVSVQDDGCGFQLPTKLQAMVGNMKRRLLILAAVVLLKAILAVEQRSHMFDHTSRIKPRKLIIVKCYCRSRMKQYVVDSEEKLVVVSKMTGDCGATRQILETAPDVKCIGAFVSAEEALPKILKNHPDVVSWT